MKRPIDKVIAEIFDKITDSEIKLTKEVHGQLLNDIADSLKGIIDYPDIDAFTEGESSLQALATTDLRTGNKISISINGITYIYELVSYIESFTSGSGSGLDPDLDDIISPYKIMPDDYDIDSNARVWQLANCKYYTFTDDDIVDGSYVLDHNIGVKYLNVQLIDSKDSLITGDTIIVFNSNNQLTIKPGDTKGPYKLILSI